MFEEILKNYFGSDFSLTFPGILSAVAIYFFYRGLKLLFKIFLYTVVVLVLLYLAYYFGYLNFL